MATLASWPVPTGSRRGRIGAWAVAALRDLGYSCAVFGWSIVGLTVLVSGVSVTASLLALVVGVFVWVGFVHVVRWTTTVDRRLAGWQRRAPVHAVYRRPASRGFGVLVKTLSADRQTWRDGGWLALTSVAGFTLGLVPVLVAAVAAAYASMPLWFWAIPHPRAQIGITHLGSFTVDSVGAALAVSVLGVALVPLALLVARGCAQAHAGLAARVLDPSDRA